MNKSVKVCHYCRNKITDKKYDLSDEENDINKYSEWLSNCNLSDLRDGSQYEENNTCDDSSTTENNSLVLKNDNICFKDEIILGENENSLGIENILEKKSNYENINIYKSQNVHIGNITHFHGPVYINKHNPTISQNITINDNKLFVVSRRTWLAQPPFDPDDVKPLTQPVKYVVICHSASEEFFTQTDNNLAVRLIQQFHIESRKWNDISYNFLFGSDGSIYEGRGWNVVGAHTFGYNRFSLGLCFIGYFSKKLPPSHVLKKAQDFLQYGVEIGTVDPEYVLLGHCQCSSTESPGRRLFEEIQTWDHWDGSISSTCSPLI